MMMKTTTTTGERPSPLKDPEVRKGLMSPDTIQGMQFTCGEVNQYGEGMIRVTIRPFCYFEEKPVWEAVYETDYYGVRPAVLVHCDPEDYDGAEYNILLVEHVDEAPRTIALFDDLTTAMATAMLANVVDAYEGCVERERERLRDEAERRAYWDDITDALDTDMLEEEHYEFMTSEYEEAYLDAIT